MHPAISKILGYSIVGTPSPAAPHHRVLAAALLPSPHPRLAAQLAAQLARGNPAVDDVIEPLPHRLRAKLNEQPGIAAEPRRLLLRLRRAASA